MFDILIEEIYKTFKLKKERGAYVETDGLKYTFSKDEFNNFFIPKLKKIEEFVSKHNLNPFQKQLFDLYQKTHKRFSEASTMVFFTIYKLRADDLNNFIITYETIKNNQRRDLLEQERVLDQHSKIKDIQEQNIIKTSEYIFDRSSKTLLKYNFKGHINRFTLPRLIENIEVKRIAIEAFKFIEIDVLILHENITHIENGGAFSVKGLKEIYLSEGLKVIGSFAFFNNEIIKVKLPNSLEEINFSSFQENNLETIIIPEKVKKIGSNAFDRNKLVSVYFQEGLREIGDEAFRYNKINLITLPRSLENIGNSSFVGNRIENLVIPENIKIIGDYAFSDNKITNIKIENGVKSIGKEAFSNNEIHEIIIPESVEFIGSGAFSKQNKKLNKVIILGNSNRFDEQWTNIGFPKKLIPTQNKLESFNRSVEVQEIDHSKFISNSLEGKQIVITGTLKYFTRQNIKDTISNLGGIVQSNVTNKTDYVIKGFENTGTKLVEAIDKNLLILDEEQFLNTITQVHSNQNINQNDNIIDKSIINDKPSKVGLINELDLTERNKEKIFTKREILKNHVFDGNRYDVFIKDSDTYLGITNGILKTNLINDLNTTIKFKICVDEIIINQLEMMKINMKQFNYFSDDDFESEVDYMGDDLSTYLNNINEELDEESQQQHDLEAIDKQPITELFLIEEISGIDYSDFDKLENINVINAEDQVKSMLKDIFMNINIVKNYLSIKSETEIINKFNLENFDEILNKNKYSLVRTEHVNFSSVITLEIILEKLNNFDLIGYIETNKILKISKEFYQNINWQTEPYYYANAILLYKGNNLEKELEEISM